MRKYEIMTIFDLAGGSLEECQEFVTNTFAANKINIINQKSIGQKDLAYPINDKTQGHYYLYNVEVEPKSFPEVEKAFKLYNKILRYLVVKQD